MPSKPRPTMLDVAARAGVSQATVSLILNDSPGSSFSPATRDKVRTAAEELGYAVPGAKRPTTSSGRRFILFLVDEFTTDPWMTLAYEGIRERALEDGIEVTLNVVRVRDSDDAIALHPEDSLAGIILGTILTRRIAPTKGLLAANAVLLNCYDSKSRLSSVIPGDIVGGRMAVDHLAKRGCKRIALINGQEELDAARDRLLGYRQALASNDLSIDMDLIRPGDWEPSSGYKQTIALLDLPEPPDGIFCANDLIAMGCYDAIRERGLRIPEDISVVGFDDREIAQYMRPPLTTFQLPQHEMGRMAAEFVLGSSVNGGTTRPQLKAECPFIPRESTK